VSEGGRRDEADDVERDVEVRIDGLRRLVEGVAVRVGGHPGVVRVQATLDTYDRAGGGLVAGGLAYTSLLALLPGLLLALSVAGYLIRDPADQQRLVAVIASALPPLEDVARAAFTQVSGGAVPSGVIALIGLVWGSSRFYANLDTAFSRIFRGAPRRNPIRQTVRGVVLVGALVVLPVVLVGIGSMMAWISDLAPNGVELPRLATALVGAVSPLGSLVVFAAVVAGCYRLVPSERVAWRALLPPAGVVGLVLAVFTQVYTFVFQRLVGVAALYGTFVAVFALLAWLSIGYNVLLLGAAWTKVRSDDGPLVEVFRRETEGEPPPPS
jgi:membrane protein